MTTPPSSAVSTPSKRILIGKLSMVELAGGGGYSSAAASLQGPGLNPWNKQYWSGGSSSGSGAAVAAGLVPLRSVRKLQARSSRPPAIAASAACVPLMDWSAATAPWRFPGHWIRSASSRARREDCGLVLHAIAGGDDDDPGSAHKSFYYAPQYYENLSDLKVGYAEVDFAEWPDEPLRPRSQTRWRSVKSIGAQMVETKLPDFPYRPAHQQHHRFRSRLHLRDVHSQRPRGSAWPIKARSTDSRRR